MPAPNSPEGLAVAAGYSTLTLTWQPPPTGVTPLGYQVRIDGGTETDVGSALAHTFTGLGVGTTHLLEVRAYA